MGFGVKPDSLQRGINVIDVPDGKGQLLALPVTLSAFPALRCLEMLGTLNCRAQQLFNWQREGKIPTTPPPGALALYRWAKLYLGKSLGAVEAGCKGGAWHTMLKLAKGCFSFCVREAFHKTVIWQGHWFRGDTRPCLYGFSTPLAAVPSVDFHFQPSTNNGA